ncbi:YkgJ family cysteine cluster protein [Ferrimonas aestuarii]|uniref:YkgJ family cysteine cluster protein n=1 Tax=Ferrimonas aestuarii TaxID=2569539 RepID=A0A4U1BP19_9GAMM|nr:YkgJ family cysteine cluster protein [Ferrimonas aestuarii]TKB55045.1 YkgJ family cysteine cluster protein [Ferrimonas aestuarii]
MECRLGCGACCIAPSISSLNKPAGERCRHLDDNNLCQVFGKPERPQVCSDFKACDWVCGNSNEFAMRTLTELEQITLKQV